MDVDTLKILFSTYDWERFFPEIACVVGGIICLFACFSRKITLRHIGWISFFYLLSIGVIECLKMPIAGSVSINFLFGGLMQQSKWILAIRPLILFAGAGVIYLSLLMGEDRQPKRSEFYPVLLWILASLMICLQSYHWIPFFVSLETASIGLYVLMICGDTSNLSIKGSLKYLLLSGFSSAILLMGIALLYGGVGLGVSKGADPLSWGALRIALEQGTQHPFLLIGTIFLWSSLAFKAGLVPFHAWIPDIYGTSILPITFLLSAISKVVILAIMTILFSQIFLPMENILTIFLSVLGVLSIFLGSIGAFCQEAWKRFMGFSSIAHAGFIALALVALPKDTENATHAILIYLCTYVLGSFMVFFVWAKVACSPQSNGTWSDITSLTKRNGYLSAVWIIGWASLAGIPPFIGFFAKLLIIHTTFKAQLHLLSVCLLLGIILSSVYSFRSIRMAFTTPHLEPEPAPIPTSLSEKGCLVLLALVAILFGFLAPTFALVS